jgi:hypothetical protein
VEREPEALAPVPVATPAAVGATPGPSLIGALTPARVLALQRTAGNRAVNAILARDKPEPSPAAGPGDFGFSGGVPVGSGNATASPNGTDKVRALAPKVTIDGKAWLKEGKTIGSAYVGIIQNLVSSDRVTVYRHGGNANGEITKESHDAQGKKWDAVNDPEAEKKGKMDAQTFAPFYWQPSNIEDTNLEGTPASVTRLGTPWDQPEFSAPVSDGGAGRLTAFRGRDVFKTGIAIKKGETVWVLNGTDWSVNWDMNVDASMNGAGKAVESSAIKNLIKDGPDPTLKDWSLKPGAGSAFEGFSTVELAMKRSPADLFKWIFAAKTHDPVSYKNICAALDAKAPNLTVSIGCESTDSNFHADYVSATVKKGGSVIKTIAGSRLNNGISTSVAVSWAEAFGSAASITSSTAFSVELYITDTASAETPAIAFPFTGTHKLAPGDGKYEVSLSV